jgi:predicted ABC-type transport system involved in lysophospholipase L1 biosynthesis ATPase subunit
VGLSHRLKHKPTELSGGERQRVAIARALINKPRLLLADEPTGNLDRNTGATILDMLDKLRADHQYTMVVVTHDAATASRANRVVRLADGLVVQSFAEAAN